MSILLVSTCGLVSNIRLLVGGIQEYELVFFHRNTFILVSHACDPFLSLQIGFFSPLLHCYIGCDLWRSSLRRKLVLSKAGTLVLIP